MNLFKEGMSQDGLTSPARRSFMGAVGRFGFTTALVGLVGNLLGSEEAMADLQHEEQDRQAAAEQTIVMATEYIVGASRSYPIMQLNLKENIQNLSHGRYYVKLVPGGQLGAGGALISKIQNGTIAIGQHSISNLAPFAPEVDLLNVPFWCGEDQRFINLVTSSTWRKAVHAGVEARGFKVLSYLCIDPRTIAVREGLLDHAVRTPDDIRGIKFRVPASPILQQFYRMAGANPTPVAWGETASAMQQGVADALDPCVQALLVYGFTDVIARITLLESVPDAQVYTCNKQWFDAQSEQDREALERAAELTFHENLAKVPAARAYAYDQMQRAGITLYRPTEDERRAWRETCGHQLEAWNDTKRRLAGSLDRFDRFVESTGVSNGYYVDSEV